MKDLAVWTYSQSVSMFALFLVSWAKWSQIIKCNAAVNSLIDKEGSLPWKLTEVGQAVTAACKGNICYFTPGVPPFSPRDVHHWAGPVSWVRRTPSQAFLILWGSQKATGGVGFLPSLHCQPVSPTEVLESLRLEACRGPGLLSFCTSSPPLQSKTWLGLSLSTGRKTDRLVPRMARFLRKTYL